MNVLFLVLAFISVIIWAYYGLLFFGNLRKKRIFRGNEYYDKEIIYPSLSVIIPACNEEESIRQAISQLLDQDYADLEVLVVNDRSTDHTAVILEELKIKYPQLKVVTITDVPTQWLGKNHAVYQGVKQATGEWLLITDADVMFSPGSLKTTVSYSLENKLDHLTISPDITYKGFFYGGFISLFLLAVTGLYLSSKSAGIGAFNLIKRSTYQEIGGYEAIAMQPIDDFSLGKLVVKKGYKQSYGFSKGLISVKLFDNLFAMIKGIEKNQFAGSNYSVPTTLAFCLIILLLHVYPFAGLFFESGWARVLCGFAIIIVFAIYNYSKKYIDVSLKHVLIHPISGLLYFWAVLNSMVKILSRGGIEWRGTVYSLEELRKHTI
ncbi:glycosyltransferase [Desulfosporosinus sp. OT]|uniref:glycosyltransferase n=1 Tax=Desulfosporosinus sp. OT TaxID=913865 RepID=UPI0002239AFA|nr:glycosyltransferase [Desulfosporosinus sp. OT]EGW40908.1 glycosyl transferase 2 family protein [Desulfosporosinus sp. OT]